MKELIGGFICILLIFNACQQNTDSQKRVEEIRAGDNVADIIRNPATADGMTDTVNVAKMTFEDTAFSFGEVKEGEVVTHEFEFTNTGSVPLVISDARSTCGCTVPEWSKEPIAPGESSSITVKFNTAGKVHQQNKPVTITANTYPSETVVNLLGYVK